MTLQRGVLVTLAVNKIRMNSPINLTWQVTATQGQLSAFPDAMNPFVVMLSTHDS